jgi:hypothetical protein
MTMRRVVVVALSGLVLGAATVGCAINMDIRMGRRPDVAALEQRLQVGQSGVEDVLAALGPPHGRGRTMLPFDDAARTTWSYSYGESSVNMGVGGTEADVRRLMLFVFFRDDQYDGYLWFSSLKE